MKKQLVLAALLLCPLQSRAELSLVKITKKIALCTWHLAKLASASVTAGGIGMLHRYGSNDEKSVAYLTGGCVFPLWFAGIKSGLQGLHQELIAKSNSEEKNTIE